MDYHQLNSSIRELVDSLSPSMPGTGRSDVVHYLDHGQDDEAMDLLVAMLVRANVPITPGQRDILRTLISEFEFDDENRRHYRYLADTEMLDRMTVVDGPS